MVVAESVVRQPNKHSSVVAKDAIWVFESNLHGPGTRGAGAIAVRCRGADKDCSGGALGSNYAILTRDGDNKLLPWDDIKHHVGAFIDYAKASPGQRFQILPGAYEKSEDQHTRFAHLFRNAPGNCELPGRCLEMLGRLNAVRVILLDANVTIEEAERTRVLNQYFAANEGLWNVEYIEIVSVGAAQSLVANAKYAKERGYRHRIIKVDCDIYGGYARQVREQLSIAYATKLVCLNDPTGTSTGNQVSAVHLASCAGLQIDDLLFQ